MICLFGPMTQIVSGRATVAYSSGFKWGFNSALAKMVAYLEALDNLRQQEPAVVRRLSVACDRRVDCAAGSDYSREFVRSIERHTGVWGGTWRIITVGKVIVPCVDEIVEVSTRGPLSEAEQEPAVAGIQIPSEQNLWMVRIDQREYEQGQYCSYTECKRNALYQAVTVNDEGRVMYVPMFACDIHIHDDAKRFGFDVPAD